MCTYNGLSCDDSRRVTMKFWVLIQNPCHSLYMNKRIAMLATWGNDKNIEKWIIEDYKTWAFVPMSGAGMSVWIPMRSCIFWVKTRVRRSSSLLLNSFGLHPIPPFAPPYGISATAVFQVISWARAFTSSGSTFQNKITLQCQM